MFRHLARQNLYLVADLRSRLAHIHRQRMEAKLRISAGKVILLAKQFKSLTQSLQSSLRRLRRVDGDTIAAVIPYRPRALPLFLNLLIAPLQLLLRPCAAYFCAGNISHEPFKRGAYLGMLRRCDCLYALRVSAFLQHRPPGLRLRRAYRRRSRARPCGKDCSTWNNGLTTFRFNSTSASLIQQRRSLRPGLSPHDRQPGLRVVAHNRVGAFILWLAGLQQRLVCTLSCLPYIRYSASDGLPSLARAVPGHACEHQCI